MLESEHKEEETTVPSEESNAPGNEEAASISSCPPENCKIVLLLRATANAPIMKKTRWLVEANKQVSWVNAFVKKYLKLEASESLFLYVNQSFAPSPDRTLRNLYDSFNTDGKLILYYCKSQAWG